LVSVDCHHAWILLILGVTNDFLLKPGHFDFYEILTVYLNLWF
jgi:hypothetical protein